MTNPAQTKRIDKWGGHHQVAFICVFPVECGDDGAVMFYDSPAIIYAEGVIYLSVPFNHFRQISTEIKTIFFSKDPTNNFA